MFTLRKLESLGEKTRLRKLVLIIQKAEIELSETDSLHNKDFFISIFNSTTINCGLPETLKSIFNNTGVHLNKTDNPLHILRGLNNLRHSILNYLGSEPAEWDLLNFNKTEKKPELDKTKRKILPIYVYLEDIRSPFNVGSIFRTGEAFGVSNIYISENTPSPGHRRAKKTARGCNNIIPWTRMDLKTIKTSTVFALETGGTNIDKFMFPESGIVLIGSEELGLSPEALKIADNSAGRVSIPMIGVKKSLNVAVAFSILMWEWYSFLVSDRASNS